METVIADDVDRRRAFEGAKRLLLRCVSLCEGDVLALFWDHTTEEPAALRLRAAEELGIEVRRRFVTLEQQIFFRT